MSSLKERTVTAIFWDILGTIANRGVTFLVSIFLARILTPEEFGLVGMVMVFIIISNGLMDIGLGSALIQKKNLDKIDFSSVFYINVLLGFVVTVLMYLSSGVLARFYSNPAIYDITRALSFVFIINSFAIVQKTRLIKYLGFKQLTIISVISASISGVISIYMALSAFGVWSLVSQILLQNILTVLMLWIVSDWYPTLEFSFKRVKSLWTFGVSIFITEFINTAVRRIDVLMIGKLFSPSILGYYTRSQSVDSLIKVIGSQSIVKVLFPTLSLIQEDHRRITAAYKNILSMLSMISLGLAGVLFVCADGLFISLFTEKWAPSIPLFQLMVLKSFIPTVSALPINILKARGRAKELLNAELIKKTLYIMAVVVGLKFGINEFLVVAIVQALITLFINFYLVNEELGITIFDHVKRMLPYVVYSIFAAGLVFLLMKNLQLSVFSDLLVRFLSFLGLFLTFLVLSKDQAFKFILSEISNLVRQGFR